MATSKKSLNEKLRYRYLNLIADYLHAQDEEVLVTGSNEICIPCLDDEGNDEFMVITFKVPTGSRDGDAYDGYALAEEYAMKCKEKMEKAKESAKKKAEKIARDKANREARAKAKAEHQAKEEV